MGQKIDKEFIDFMSFLGDCYPTGMSEAIQEIVYAALAGGVNLAAKTLRDEGNEGIVSLMAEIEAFRESLSADAATTVEDHDQP